MLLLGVCDSVSLSGSLSVRECKAFVKLMDRMASANQSSVSYLEYGCGISTLLAASRAGRVVSVDTSEQWIDVTRMRLDKARLSSKVQLVHVDVGPLGPFGLPLLPNVTASHYCKAATRKGAGREGREGGGYDVVLIDGRFRVACAAHAYSLLSQRGVLLVHDYSTRRHAYKNVNQLYNMVSFTQSLAFFRPKPYKSGTHLFLKHYKDTS